MADPLTIYAAVAVAVFVVLWLTEGPAFGGAFYLGLLWPLAVIALVVVLAGVLAERFRISQMTLRTTLSVLIALLLVAWAAHMTSLRETVERYQGETE